MDRDADILNGKMLHPPPPTGKTGNTITRPIVEISSALFDLLTTLVETHVDEHGHIDYDALQNDKHWSFFMDDLLELNLVRFPVSPLS